MYPWKSTLTSWAESTHLHIDALGLITILGADEVNTSVGRLVTSRYVEFLPLLAAFTLASNQFTSKQTNFTLYNLSKGIKTTEVAGWFSRWLKMQNFHQIHNKVQWKVSNRRPRTPSSTWTSLAIGAPCHGIMVAMTVLSGDWWGFANVTAMILSVVVRSLLVRQNRLGIDQVIEKISQDHHASLQKAQASQAPQVSQDSTQSSQASGADEFGPDATVMVITDDSKVITMFIPDKLVGLIFTQTPVVPSPQTYKFWRWVGWAAFAVHIISLGMATLPTQMCTVLIIVISTILTTFKFGCDDWRMQQRIEGETARGTSHEAGNLRSPVDVSCRISSRLHGVCSQYPADFEEAFQKPEHKADGDPRPTPGAKAAGSGTFRNRNCWSDLESCRHGVAVKKPERSRRRQHLYIWMELNKEKKALLSKWDLVPDEQNKVWWREFESGRIEWEKKYGQRSTGETKPDSERNGTLEGEASSALTIEHETGPKDSGQISATTS